MPESHLRALSTRFLAACKQGCLPTVRSIAPGFYNPLNRSLLIPPMTLALATAARHGHAQVFRYLLGFPLCVNSTGSGWRPWSPYYPHPRDRLTEWWAEADDQCVPTCATESGSPSVMQALLDAGMSVEEEIERVGPPLALAIQRRDLVMVKFLLDKGADPNAYQSIPPMSVLASAAFKNLREIVLTLIEHGADMGESGALWVATEAEHYGMIELLLDNGMNVNSLMYWLGGTLPEDNEGTALHAAVWAEKKDMVAFLLKKGVDKNVKNGAGETPLDIAKSRRDIDLVNVLESLP